MNYGNKRKFGVPFFPFILVVVALFLGLIVMLLWNAILSPVLGISTITYWQAVGLFVLSRILFGGFKGGGHMQGKSGCGPQWRQKWLNMTEEERAKFRQEWTSRCRPRKPTQE